MDNLYIRRSNSIVDLEIGGSSSTEDDEVKGSSPGGQKADNKLGRLETGSLSSIRMIRNGDESSSSGDTLSSNENLEISVGERGERVKNRTENGVAKEKKKKRSAKPPLPPRGSSLHAADVKLLREMSELARLKHARIQRIKALKKKRAEKASSSSNTFFPMVITVVFFCIIIFQGFLGSRVR